MSSSWEDETAGADEPLVAVIGMSARFPGAEDVRTFWDNLRTGRNHIQKRTHEELKAAGVPQREYQSDAYVPFSATVDDIDCFDAAFFNVSPKEAELLDPQQRLILEASYHALEDAGLVVGNLPERVGVYAGARFSDYLVHHLYSNPDLMAKVGYFQAMLGNDKDYMAPLISYKLDLDGPSMNVQSACSTGLVAVHQGCEALLSHNCNLVIAGAVALRLPQQAGYFFQPGGIFSASGMCRTFDAEADGTVFGNGVGVVVLKRLEDAQADDDFIYGLVLGSAVNNDGGRKVGLTAPSAAGQARVIADALAIAEVEPEQISYIECHGTATALGDAIEVAALNKVFSESATRCALGSVKTNFGHLEAAAGMAGLIKALLMLRHRRLVPSLHFQTPNPQLGLEQGPFYVNTEDTPWPEPESGQRIAGISSFGIGGTNAHLLVGEAPERSSQAPAKGPHLLRLSARDAEDLQVVAKRLGHFLGSEEVDLGDVAKTLSRARQSFEVRQILVAHDSAEAAAKLLGGQGISGSTALRDTVVFLFPGQGAQYPGMGGSLYKHEPVFRQWIDRGCQQLKPHLDADLHRLLTDPGDNDAATLARTEVTQPALFLVSYAMAQVWLTWGLKPAAFMGHSVGEIVAACLAGVFDFDTALKMVARRGALMASCPKGAMLSVQMDAESLKPFLAHGLTIASYNGPELVSVSGDDAAIGSLESHLRAAGKSCRLLPTSHGFHSKSMDVAVEPFQTFVASLPCNQPESPFISNVTGTWITAEQATDPGYWAQQMRQPVCFYQGLQVLAEKGMPLWLEVGPGQSCAGMVRQTHSGSQAISSLPTATSKQCAEAHLYEAVGRLWIAGVDVGPQSTGQRIPIPGYPFKRTRYWVEPGGRPSAAPEGVGAGLPWSGHASCEAAAPVNAPVEERPDEAHQRPKHLQATYVPPKGELEQQLAQIWSDQLGVSPVGRTDDFFDLGGHSLLATRVLAQIAQAMNVTLTLNHFFEGGTLAHLAQAIKQAQVDGVNEIPLIPASVEKAPVLTPAQERLWFLHQMAPQSPAYNLPGAFTLRGPFSLPAMEQALGDLMNRHQILCCRFPTTSDGRPKPTMDEATLVLDAIDLSHLQEEDALMKAGEVRRDEMLKPFDLANQPLIRAQVVRFATDHHLILLNLHHMVADGGSFTLLARDLRALYDGRLAGKASQLPALPIQYLDYALWLEQHLQGSVLERLDSYWRERLAGAPLVLDLDTDFPRPAIADHSGGRLPLVLDAETTQALRALGRTEGSTMFMTLTAVFQILLWHRCGNSDFLLGTHVTHRNRSGLEHLVGLFVNQMVMRAELGGNPSFREFLQRTRGDILGGFQHQDMPFERLVELLQPQRDLSRNPVVQVMFVFQNHPSADAADNLPLPETGQTLAVRDDLRLELYEGDGALQGFLEYRASLFRSETIARLGEQFCYLARQVVANPERDLRALILPMSHLSLQELSIRSALLSRSSQTPGPPLHERWLTGETRWPQRIALVAEADPCALHQSLTYQTLATRGRLLAANLRHLGVGAEDKVGLYMDRSASFVVGILGTLCAGAAFVPLDRRAPARRLAYQLEKTKARVILTLSNWNDLPDEVRENRTVLCLDQLSECLDADLPTVHPMQTAYVLFTSGSTGEPKGVAVAHRQLACYVDAMIQRLNLQAVPYAWILATTADAGHTALFPTLAIGGTLHAVSPDVAAQPASLATYLKAHKIQDMKVMPGLLQSLQVGGHMADVLPAKHLVMTGEAAELTWIKSLRQANPDMRIDNEYGPTEATVGVTVARMDREDLDEQTHWPLGTPLAGTACYLVDGLDRSVAAGMRGELHLGGDLVATGYLNDPARTAQSFIPDPFIGKPGSRRYRTGDYARITHDGHLLFHGRIDTQVKLRGFRLEVGEIESHLRGHEAVDACVVRLKKDPHPRLVAYIVPREPGTELSDIRAWLTERLPPIMVPAAWMLLTQLPLSPNGKLDEGSLPIPHVESKPELRLPETPVARQLAAIWCQVLQRDAVGLDDNFFALGGDSLTSIQVIALAQRAGLALQPQTLFVHQTLGEQADILIREGLNTTLTSQAAVLLQPAGEGRPVFCVHSAGGMVFGYLALARGLGDNQPFIGLQDVTYFGGRQPDYTVTVEILAERYVKEIRAHQPRGPYRLMGHSFGGLVALAVATLIEAAGEEVEFVALLDTAPPGSETPGSREDTLKYMVTALYRLQDREAPVLAFGTDEPSNLEQAAQALGKLKGLQDLDAERLGTLVDVFCAHDQAANNYALPTGLQGKLILCHPEGSTVDPVQWQTQLKGTWDVLPTSGDHTTMLADPHATSLAQSLKPYLT